MEVSMRLDKAIKKLSRIRNPELRKLAAKMWVTSETIRRMEEYHRQHYE
jgi:hypothetical protein